MYYFTSVLIFMLQILFLMSVDYCNLCKPKGSHPMCKYPVPGPVGACAIDYKKYVLTDEEKVLIVKLHNQYRDRVARGLEKRGSDGPQPTASNMRQMYWDDELAEIAQRLVDQCRPYSVPSTSHDKCSNSERFYVGYNIGRSSAPQNIVHTEINSVRAWYNGVKDFGSADLRSFGSSKSGKDVGHYTQVVWKSTYLVGCGRVFWRERKGKGDPDFYRFACNYGPGGNMLGSSVYNIGAPCSACPKGTSCSEEYKGLCAVHRNVSQHVV